MEERLANFINKDSSTIHNWRNKTSGPSDLETIQLIAKFFEIEDYKLLFNEENENMKKLSDLQMLSVKRIYDMIMDYLEESKYNNTNKINSMIPSVIACAVPVNVTNPPNASINICGRVAMIPAIMIKLKPLPIPF